METTEIVGGLNVKDVVEGGALFNIKEYDASNEDVSPTDEELTVAMQQFLKLECLDFGEESDKMEPFSHIAKKMENLLENGNIKKRILREGYGSKPEKSSIVNIHYNAYIQYEAQPFDSTYARKKLCSFTIGGEQVIEGLEIAVCSMKINEKAQFLIEPELAYRSGGLNRIPPDAVVLFEVELFEVHQSVGESVPECNEKLFQYVYPKCLALCVKGKNFFRLKDYQGAIKEYNTAVNELEDAVLNDYEDQKKMEELLVRLCTNLLISCTHAEIPKRGCIFAQRIYKMAKNETFNVSAKVYFNHAKCLIMLGGYEHAQRRLYQAKALEPKNGEIQQEIAALTKRKMEYKKHEANLGRALLS